MSHARDAWWAVGLTPGEEAALRAVAAGDVFAVPEVGTTVRGTPGAHPEVRELERRGLVSKPMWPGSEIVADPVLRPKEWTLTPRGRTLVLRLDGDEMAARVEEIHASVGRVALAEPNGWGGYDYRLRGGHAAVRVYADGPALRVAVLPDAEPRSSLSLRVEEPAAVPWQPVAEFVKALLAATRPDEEEHAHGT